MPAALPPSLPSSPPSSPPLPPPTQVRNKAVSATERLGKAETARSGSSWFGLRVSEAVEGRGGVWRGGSAR